MTDRAINIVIAKACGWVAEKNDGQAGGWNARCPLSGAVGTLLGNTPQAAIIRNCPDYCNDLNAMHEAEQELDDEQWLDYARYLGDTLSVGRIKVTWWSVVNIMQATARQRAEAFLRTLNKADLRDAILCHCKTSAEQLAALQAEQQQDSAFLRWYNSSAWAGAGKDAGELAAAAWNAAMLHTKAEGSAS